MSSSSSSSNHHHPLSKIVSQLVIPGSFVVLQGSPGDGVLNTMDHVPPPLLPLEEDHDEEKEDHQDTMMVEDDDEGQQRQDKDDYEDPPLEEFQETSSSDSITTPNTNSRMVDPPASLSASISQQEFVVVTDHGEQEEEEEEEEEDRRRPHDDDQHRQHPHIHFTNTTTTTNHHPVGCPRLGDTTGTTTTTIQQERQKEKLFQKWKTDNQRRIRLERQEWIQAANDMMMLPSSSSPVHKNKNHIFLSSSRQGYQEEEDDCSNNGGGWWWLYDSKVAVLREIPTQLSNGTVLTSYYGSLYPGTTLIATNIVYLDSQTLQRIPIPPHRQASSQSSSILLQQESSSQSSSSYQYPPGRMGWIILLEMEYLGRTAYVVQSCDGYSFLGPGLGSWYTKPACWIWRVTCPAGAFVRSGLELHSQHLETLPYGSLVQVRQRTVNTQGLCRLQISAIAMAFDDDDDNHKKKKDKNNKRTAKKRLVEGWCSEALNPLSGNRGNILVPLPFPVPAVYKVAIAEGAVVRSGIDLSSHEMGRLQYGTHVTITGRAFAEHPMENCLERLRLASGGGWLSLRLNRPGGANILQSARATSDTILFDPEKPADFHWTHMMMQHRHANHTHTNDLSSIDSDAVSSSEQSSLGGGPSSSPPKPHTKSPRQHKKTTTKTTTSGPLLPVPKHQKDSQCLICLTQERNATIVHGETGHVACCLVCARILKARGDKCPVCRLDIDLVIQHFWA